MASSFVRAVTEFVLYLALLLISEASGPSLTSIEDDPVPLFLPTLRSRIGTEAFVDEYYSPLAALLMIELLRFPLLFWVPDGVPRARSESRPLLPRIEEPALPMRRNYLSIDWPPEVTLSFLSAALAAAAFGGCVSSSCIMLSWKLLAR